MHRYPIKYRTQSSFFMDELQWSQLTVNPPLCPQQAGTLAGQEHTVHSPHPRVPALSGSGPGLEPQPPQKLSSALREDLSSQELKPAGPDRASSMLERFCFCYFQEAVYLQVPTQRPACSGSTSVVQSWPTRQLAS